MGVMERIEVRIGELVKLVEKHEAAARDFTMLGQTHRVQEETALARGYSQAKLELQRLIVAEDAAQPWR